MIHLTADNVLAAIDRAIDNKGPDHTIYRCRYIDPVGNGLCLIGCVLLDLGVPVEVFPLPWVNSHGEVITVNEVSISKIIDQLPVTIDDDLTVQAMDIAQRMQDKGYSWGVARRAFVGATQKEGITL